MTQSLSNQPQSSRRTVRGDARAPSRTDRPRLRRGRESERKKGSRRRRLARYLDWNGVRREVIARRGIAGSVLVVDRDAETLGDRRLVAHLGADEPPENAALVCRLYLDDSNASGHRCRSLREEDLQTEPLEEQHTSEWTSLQRDCRHHLLARDGGLHQLELVQTGMSIPELRWQRRSRREGEQRSVSVRDVIAALERYEPVRTLTRSALALHDADPTVSVTVLRAEFARVLVSPIVLNRGLRDAVLATMTQEELSMSEIAARCGRIKRDSRGNESGETSWLARRLGMLPEGGHESPTPWIHSDVLGLISRRGLGVSPREVEL
jgi:hypothetical protein